MALLRRILAGAAVVWLVCSLTPALAQTADWTLDEYQQLVREALASAQRNDEIGLRDAAAKLKAITELQAPDGSILPVNNSWLTTELDKSTVNMQRIATRLGTIIEVLTHTNTSDPAALEQLRGILSNPPFNYNLDVPDVPVSLSGGDWLASLFSISKSCLTFLGILAVVILIGYFVVTLRNNSLPAPRKLTSEPNSEELPMVKSSGEAIQRADQVAQEERDFRKAVRFLYLSTLLWLSERQVLAFDRTLTNREVLAAIPTASPLHARLAPVVQTFDRVWYGFKDIDQAAFEHFRQQVTALREGR